MMLPFHLDDLSWLKLLMWLGSLFLDQMFVQYFCAWIFVMTKPPPPVQIPAWQLPMARCVIYCTGNSAFFCCPFSIFHILQATWGGADYLLEKL